MLWRFLADPFGNGVYPLSTAVATTNNQELRQPQYTPIWARDITGNSIESPDYGTAFVCAQDGDQQIMSSPLSADLLPYVALFELRVWKTASAVIKSRNGDGQNAACGRFFETPLSAYVVDSQGSIQGTHGVPVRFDIVEGDATFDAGGYIQRLATVTATSAQVFSEHGTAFAPRIKAGITVGSIKIRASSPFAAQPFYFELHAVDKLGPTDAAFVAVFEGDYQDVTAPGGFALPLVAKVQNQYMQPAQTGKIVFTAYPGADGQPLSAVFGNVGTATVSADVVEGYAEAPTLLTAVITATPASGYTSNIICAYPDTFDIEDEDPRTDTSGAVGRYTERVWAGKAALLSRDDSKNGQTTAPGQFFPNRLTATAQDANHNGVDRMAVTFTLQGPGQFDNDDSVPVQAWSQKLVIVRTNSDGLATAPRIQALSGQEGDIGVTISCPVSNYTPTYTLISAIPPDEGVSVGLAAGDMQDQILGMPFANPMSVSVKNAKGANATAGQVTFTCKDTADATGSFKGTASATVDVQDGSAIAPATLQGDSVVQQHATYGYFEVAAATAHTQLPPVFRQRVWRARHAVLSQVSGGTPDNKTKPGELFPIPVVAYVAGPDAEDIQDLLVTFTLQGPAEFVYDDFQKQPDDTATSATVRSDAHGIAAAPAIRAEAAAQIEADSDPIIVTADATVAQTPLPFNLTLLPPLTKATYVYADPATDLQAALAAQPFAVPLAVSVKNPDGSAATTGSVTFKIFPVGATGFFPKENDRNLCVAQVTDGRATTTTLSAGGVPGAPFGIFRVVAYPSNEVPDDPLNDDSDQTAHFIERVWAAKYVTLAKQDGDAQHAGINQFFPAHPTVKVTDQSNRNMPVGDYLVNFSISDSTLATFDLTDTDPDVSIVSGSSQSVQVRGGPNGIATAPRILAGATAASFQVQAQGTVDQGATFQLTVDGTPPQQKLYTLKPDAAQKKIPPDGSNMAIFTLQDSSARGVGGKVVTFSLDQAGIVSFSPTDPSVTTAPPVTTTETGEASILLYAGENLGTVTLTATNVQSTDGQMKITVGN
ncbi:MULTISPECIES: hypothetical protein [unclassified Achromobacter]|uniref:hypothetical protein n=1 Tax=unclassified Achromobacter TaxID=2626865 RepID=UPI000B51B150|nr:MULTISPECIES: hypothetical protein [unclassified Achromobacter]OWT74612.1 hypothetical protein CEY05_18630 [Achromobacter sp. HZ34]OWT79079.1 hypothetical protein CEY04_08550 [Achromobacter sp. HZ28]